MKIIAGTILKDNNGYYAAGCEKSLNIKRIEGPVFIATETTDPECVEDTIYEGEIVKEDAEVSKVPATKIIDNVLGVIYVQETVSELNDLLNGTACCGTSEAGIFVSQFSSQFV